MITTILLTLAVAYVFDIGFGAAFLIVACGGGIVLAIIVSQTHKENKEFESTKDERIATNEKNYQQYLSDFTKIKETIVGKCPLKSYKVDSETSVFKTADNYLIVATCREPTNYVYHKPAENSVISGSIDDAKRGVFYVKYKCSVNDILYWVEKGSLQYTTSVSGGGINARGAVAGALIAGDAGAIIGSREAITSQTEEHDSREIILKLQSGDERSFPYSLRQGFVTCIPEKEYTYLQMKNMAF